MKDAKGHGSDARNGGGMSQDARRNAGNAAHGKMPLAGHPFHTKTNDELQFIAKDASAAAKNMQGMGNAQAEGKYLDQVNDASTVLGYRQRGGDDLSKGPAADIATQHGVSGPAAATSIWNRPAGSSMNMVSNAALNSKGHAWGSPEAIKDFAAEHGGPRDNAAEQRGFNSGAREINQLKRQGK